MYFLYTRFYKKKHHANKWIPKLLIGGSFIILHYRRLSGLLYYKVAFIAQFYFVPFKVPEKVSIMRLRVVSTKIAVCKQAKSAAEAVLVNCRHNLTSESVQFYHSLDPEIASGSHVKNAGIAFWRTAFII